MPIINLSSIDAIHDYYVDTLGFQHMMGVVGKDGQLDFVSVVRDGAKIMFARRPGESDKAGERPVQIYLEVDDVDAYHDELKKKKVRVAEALTTQWWGDRTFKVLDPAGYELWFYETVGEPKPPAGAKLV